MPAQPSPLDAEDLRVRVHKVLETFLEEQQAVLDGVGDELLPVLGAAQTLLSGGKRLRPAFAYWGWRGAGGADGPEIVRAAAALEFLQACALIHDDVMDDSDTRRGNPSVHRKFAGLHRTAQWVGSPESFGVGAAILLGDLTLTWADEMLFSADLPLTDLARAKPVYDRMRTELMAGQYLDLLEQAKGGGSVERALRVARYKAAKYTIEGPLHLGATLAGAPDELLTQYSSYGIPLGEAFQLRDDVLGVFGNPQVTGKPAGDDLREGKRTVLVAVAEERCSPTQQALLNRHLGDPHLTSEGVADLRTLIEETGALGFVEELIVSLVDESHRALNAMSTLAQPALSVLGDLSYAATRRAE